MVLRRHIFITRGDLTICSLQTSRFPRVRAVIIFVDISIQPQDLTSLSLVSGRDSALSVAADLHHVRVQRGDGLHRHPQQEHHHLHQDQARHQAPVHCGTLSVAELATLEMLDETGPVWNRSWIKKWIFFKFSVAGNLGKTSRASGEDSGQCHCQPGHQLSLAQIEIGSLNVFFALST